MISKQKYISKELTHFIGRGLNKSEQYKLLLHIINNNWLTSPPHLVSTELAGVGELQVNKNAKFSNNEMFAPQVLCFCDIPVNDLSIHVNKYSYFGIAFLKQFLIEKGANPVFYLSKNSLGFGGQNRASRFDKLVPSLIDYLWKNSQANTIELLNFLEYEIFSYIKVFDDSLDESSSENYYMEREWRLIGHVQFKLEDISRIILPQKYLNQFRKDLPAYSGAIKVL